MMAGTAPWKPAQELSIEGGRRTFVPNSFGDSSRFLWRSVAMAVTWWTHEIFDSMSLFWLQTKH